MENSNKKIKELYPKYYPFIVNDEESVNNKIELANPDLIFNSEEWKNLSYQEQMEFIRPYLVSACQAGNRQGQLPDLTGTVRPGYTGRE